ncbi:ATP synthase F1, gamma subunit [Rubrobacter xylanophilus DSM 9941]|uniref:ATP synthase gamma chain n=1 Tax=Rubrobacter xylanophilus (strain DSM 9941 / JCM 11954 / NBRC 16129 / PRD-1) TaxID=266117 RepID=ATPG_RUBXD|nr:ATP synthase F1 subunit gamma [Rubrobacter xylanophilus]Q1AVH8.1 RecName: Full=ATP synthase gamma chain; AltName: Full=ATP synthase F1 sector gamma subunit; AltName: Full=F-ATPase gamma subunit [Rubrobacter xylanophilus DSM 9941]ABG04600.1 ATP synthase F1, gamma subunit [Rubrobacter xylanophilus DSM 9941]
MASLRDLKRQIQSVKNIAKVTDALQAVSAVKFRKAEARVKQARPYAENMEEVMRAIASKASTRNPMLAGREQVRRVAVATLTSDRGLCGSFNAQVLRRTVRFREQQGAEALQVASGRKGIAFFRFRRIGLAESYSGFTDDPSYEDAQRIGRGLTRLFEREEADEVYLVYNRFVNPAVQRPVVVRLLPAAPEGGEEGEGGTVSGAPFDFIPDADTILRRLIPQYVETLVWQALLESAAGEHGARMTAMKNATDNANELVDTLTLQMNKARQAQITREISEIAAGAEALAAG